MLFLHIFYMNSFIDLHRRSSHIYRMAPYGSNVSCVLQYSIFKVLCIYNFEKHTTCIFVCFIKITNTEEPKQNIQVPISFSSIMLYSPTLPKVLFWLCSYKKLCCFRSLHIFQQYPYH